MGYFSGIGAGKGWLKLQFVTEPEVLRDIFVATKAVLVITNGRVPTKYLSTPLSKYVEAYGAYLKAILETAEVHWSVSGAADMGLTTSLDHFEPEACPDKRFKLMNPQEPVINLRPSTLYYDTHRHQLCTNVMSKLYFGMELSYPRVCSLSRDKHEFLYETTELANHALFQDMKSRIQKITRPCVIKSLTREHRTQIRITDKMREAMSNHRGLKASGLSII